MSVIAMKKNICGMWVLLSSWCLTSFSKCLCMQESAFEGIKGVKATKELSSGTELERLILIYASK